MPLELVAGHDAGLELLEREPLRLGADVLAGGVLAHPPLEEGHGVALPATLGGLAIASALDW